MNVHFAYDNMTSCDKHTRVLVARSYSYPKLTYTFRVQSCKIDTKTSLRFIQIQAPLSGPSTVRYCRTERRVRYLRLEHRHIYCFRYRRTRRTAAARAKADSGADEKYFITVVAYQSYCRPKLLSLLQSTTGAVYATSSPRTRHGRAPENSWARLFSFYKTMRMHAGVIFRPRAWSTTRLKPVYRFGFWCRFHAVGPPKQIHPECRPSVMPPHSSIICVRRSG